MDNIVNADTTAQKQGKAKKRVIGRPFKKGQSGNPKGRPKGSFSIKHQVRKYLQEHPEENEKFVMHFIEKNRELAWQMLEGRPHQGVGMEVSLPDTLIGLIKHGNNGDADEGGDTEVSGEDS